MHRSTFSPLQDANPTPSFGGFGVRRVADRRNRLVSSKLKSERRHLRPLPPAPVPEYVNYRARVRRWSTIRVSNRTYSVPSRLIGVVVDVRLYADHIEVYYKGHLVESMERLHGAGEAQIDYRHIIGSLVRKPGAFARYPLQGLVLYQI